ncbi:rhodanese-related sulfurtransferase [Rubritalea tangerina]|uniref:tRNA uridine(34) hydroxylase n=1 Tax=Rubritalea tangerina TaxID=430798 RepID=A0ABW4ZC88_9BACT
MTDAPYQVLLYYLYTEIENPEAYRDAHRELCEGLGLKGRIIIGKEGINGTLSGLTADCQKYVEAMKADPLTSAMEFKIDPEQGHVFPKLSIKAREEIVTLGLGEEDFSPNECTGKYLEPTEWRDAIKDPNAVIIDARNDYEFDLGRFKGAIRPPLTAFKEFPEWIRENRESFEGKRILTYCTGGIRCEKFSGFLVREGFEDVSQLHGGIVKYGKDPEARGEDFDGLCYVFDERIAVPVNHVNPEVVAHCVHCGEASERYVNCANKLCNAQHFCCEACEGESKRCCSEACQEVYSAKYEGAVN